jgi:class 3 adenylate cyclase/predicted ATPase
LRTDRFSANVQPWIRQEQALRLDSTTGRLTSSRLTLQAAPRALASARKAGNSDDGDPVCTDACSREAVLRAPSGEASLSEATAGAERRQLTILFCDLVTSTQLSTQLDPEALREVIYAYHTRSVAVIERFGGHIAQFLGDGLLVYFGYPAAHEDDPRRAVCAGLELIETIQRIPAATTRLQARVGIHTGLVVVGDVGGGARHERLAIGEPPNLAARLQGVAAPGTVVISAATQRLVAGWFDLQDRGEIVLAGFARPVAVHRVVRETTGSRLDVTASSRLTPLVGRKSEVAFLEERWAQVKDGLGQVVLVSGEAGIGKSRLIQVLKTHLTDERHFELECRCSAYTQHSALYPVVDLLRRVLELRDDDAPETKQRKLEQALQSVGSSQPEIISLLASLLSIPLDERYPELIISPDERKERTFEALLSLLLAATTRQPVLLVVEDIHWADPSTFEFIDVLIGQVPAVRLLTILVYRPDFRPRWDFRDYLTQLTLTRLTAREAEIMVANVAGDKRLPRDVLEHVVTKTDGVPLFVEELTKMVLESDWLQEREASYELAAPLPSLAIPATLSDSLMARLDRLATAKPVAQLGAVIGRQFSYALLRAVSALDEDTLRLALGRLVAAQMLYQRGVLPQTIYMFKHALIQEAAYQSLLKSVRQQYHQRIAEVMSTEFRDAMATQPELVAHHFEYAGLVDQAIPYWLQSGQQAVERSANAEAIRHLSKGLEVLHTLPTTGERLRQELTFLVTLGAPLFMLKGHASPEVEHLYSRALELARRVGDNGQCFAALMGLARFYIAAGQLRMAQHVREQSLVLADVANDPILQREARLMLGTTLYYLGELDAARSYLEQGLALPGPPQELVTTFSRGTHPETFSRAHLAWTLWTMGYPDRALRTVLEAVEMARKLAHPYSLAHALHFATALYHWRREAQATQTCAEETLILSGAQGFDRWTAGCRMMRGWALAEQGAVAEGLVELEQGLAAWRIRAGALGLPDYLPMLADVYAKSGQIQAAHDAIAEGLALIEKTDERRFEAELHRVRGELLLLQSVQSSQPPEAVHWASVEAEAAFQHAILVARSQHAKSLELRAVLSLGRLWRARGKRAEARRALEEICDWFAEGFETADLREVRAVLGTLQT